MTYPLLTPYVITPVLFIPSKPAVIAFSEESYCEIKGGYTASEKFP